MGYLFFPDYGARRACLWRGASTLVPIGCLAMDIRHPYVVQSFGRFVEKPESRLASQQVCLGAQCARSHTPGRPFRLRGAAAMFADDPARDPQPRDRQEDIDGGK